MNVKKLNAFGRCVGNNIFQTEKRTKNAVITIVFRIHEIVDSIQPIEFNKPNAYGRLKQHLK